MSTIALAVTALGVGVLLGLFCFGGLWWTVRRGLVSSRPAAWFGLSALVRMGVVIATLYLVTRAGGLASVGTSLVGILIGRAVVTRWMRMSPPARAI